MTEAPLSSWREVFTALRCSSSRLYATLVLVTGFALYTACVEVTLLWEALVCYLATRPPLDAAFGHGSVLTVVQLVTGAAGGVLLLVALPWATRVLWRWSASIWTRPPSQPGAWSADAVDLLDLYVMSDGPRSLSEVVWVLSPCRQPPSWRHPWRRFRTLAGWGRRNAEIAAEAGVLAGAGLLRCTEDARWWGERTFEITDAGRAVSEAAAVGVTEGAS